LGVKERTNVKRQKARQLTGTVCHKHRVIRSDRKARETVANESLRRGITKLAQQICNLQRIGRDRLANVRKFRVHGVAMNPVFTPA
jgi:hypothetical protein